MNELFKRLGVTYILATPYHPLTNGQIERYNAPMDAKIATLCNVQRTNWNEQLPFVTFNYNTSVHATSGIVPFNMMCGHSPLLPFDLHDRTVSLPTDKNRLMAISPIGHSPIAKVHGYIGEILGNVMVKMQWTFAIGETPIGESLIGEIPIARKNTLMICINTCPSLRHKRNRMS
jgi:hypothetical protein